MSAAIDRTRWARRPHPRTVQQLVDIARRNGHHIHARVQLDDGWADVFLHGTTILHARAGWALGRRALVRICNAEPLRQVHLQHHGTPTQVTIDRPWPRLRAELSWSIHASAGFRRVTSSRPASVLLPDSDATPSQPVSILLSGPSTKR